MIDPTEFFLTRRSVRAVDMDPGAPSAEDQETILAAGLRVPDHGKLAPFQFVVFQGAARAKFGEEVLAPRYEELHGNVEPDIVAREQGRFVRAGLVVAVVFTPREAKVPVWEQQMAAGAACMNMLTCAQALGYAGQWLTEWYSYDDKVLAALGGDPERGHKVAGVLYFGGKQSNTKDRPRPDPKNHIKIWS